MSEVRHKVFISYHHADKTEVEKFISTFHGERKVLISRALGMTEDIINSKDTDYVMKRIRKLLLKDSTVTIVMLGKCTWARRYVDWELQSSLRSGSTVIPNGLLAIKLPSYKNNGYPNRLKLNLKSEGKTTDYYARVYDYPTRRDSLRNWINDAYGARTQRAKYINNPRERFSNSRTC